MRRIRAASFEEFARWYLARERRKERRPDSELNERSWDSVLREMRRAAPGKMRPWFSDARWSIVSLDSIGDAMNLVCVDTWETRMHGLVSGTGLDNRLSRTVIRVAHEAGYFDHPEVRRTNSVERHTRQDKIDAFRRNWPRLSEGERLTLRSLNALEKEENPGGAWYLHDGFGRLLAYLYLTVYEGYEYLPIEAFLAEEQ